MKNIHYFLFGISIVTCLFIGGFVGKKFAKTETITLYDTVVKIDTILHEITLPRPKADTFYVQEILYDSADVVPISTDTLAMIEDYMRTRKYSDTLVNNESLMIHLTEKVRFNQISSRALSYKLKYVPEPITITTNKKNIRLYVGTEFSVNKTGPSELSLGIGLKDKKDRFYKLTNNFVDGLGFDVGIGLYIPITK